MKITLKIQGRQDSQEYVLSQNCTVTFGRSRSCELQLADGKTSGQHCRFTFKPNRLELVDLDSKNGTYLNGIRIEQTEIFIGDEVRIGETLVTLDEKKMEAAAVKALSFEGKVNDRLDYALKADFTGARINNQLNQGKNHASHIQEVNLRRKAKSSIKISKQEIRHRNKLTSLMATLIDLISLLIVLALPLFIIATLPATIGKGTRLLVLGVLSSLMGMGFIYYNYKKGKFTFGEIVTGIRKIYDQQ